MITSDITNLTKELFDISYFSDDFNHNRRNYIEKAITLVETAGWDTVFTEWFNYLIHNCISAESVINYIHLYRCYDDYSHTVPDPYNFLGYFYYRLELNPAKYDIVDNMDEMSFEILMKAGIKKDLWLDDSYVPEKDPEIIKSVELWKEKLSNQQ